VVASALDPFAASGAVVSSSSSCTFGRRDRVFSLGTIVAQLGEPDKGADLSAAGLKANLKFVNPIKVPCTVNFAIKPRGTYPPGTPC
jgi:hypothetical protein